jgi:hypothetical protein
MKAKNKDLRQENYHATDALHDAVGQQARERPRRQRLAQPAGQEVLAVTEQVHQRPGPGEDGLEDQRHHRQEQDRAPDAVRQDAVQPIRPGDGPLGRPLDAAGGDLANPGIPAAGLDRRHRAAGGRQAGARLAHLLLRGRAVAGGQALLRPATHVQQQPPHQEQRHVAEGAVQSAHLALEGRGKGRRLHGRCGLGGGGDDLAQTVQADALVRLDGHHRDAHLPRQAVGVYGDALCLRHVEHVEGQDDGHAQFEDLGGQVEVALEVGGVRDGHDDVGPDLALLLAEDDVNGHHLVGAARRQAVGARQVDQVESPSGAGHVPLLGFDGDAGVVADVLPQAGQGVEESRLAGVGVADQGGGEPPMTR